MPGPGGHGGPGGPGGRGGMGGGPRGGRPGGMGGGPRGHHPGGFGGPRPGGFGGHPHRPMGHTPPPPPHMNRGGMGHYGGYRRPGCCGCAIPAMVMVVGGIVGIIAILL